jgi:hypothetical protein
MTGVGGMVVPVGAVVKGVDGHVVLFSVWMITV